ncbi:uncharacterized protein [Arachis hypogaea]|uniref:uncharacterized protein n=1 Tax=Arachis hypogaea TaxID=3818 RepID=UPI000DECFFEB|nr:uncharacterized protein LOC112803417 [Arachis hypogaea]
MIPSPATRLLCFSFRLSATSSPRSASTTRHSPHHRIQSSAPLTRSPSRSPSSLLDARRSIPPGPGSIRAAVQEILQFVDYSLLVAVGCYSYNRGKTDPAWGHCKQVLDKEKTALVCIYCEKLIRGGGINRVKHHLAGKGGDIEACRKVPAVVRHQFNQNIEDLRTKKRKTQEEYAESYGACDDVEREFDEIERNEMRQQQASRIPAPSSRKGVGKQLKGLQSFFPSAATPGAQPSIKSVLQSKEIVEKCDIAIARWMMDASMPFNAVNSAYYQPMIDAIANMGAGYKGPNYQRVHGYLLSKLVEDVKKMIEGYRVIWKQTGCTIMADGWTDRCRRTLINFLVYCPKGTVFLKSVDASHISKTAEALFKLLRDVVLFVGPENVVHVVTDNAANYVAAGRLLESEFPRLYWSPWCYTPCAAHCINLMLQDIGKLVEVTETVSQASMITKYVYNHCHPLYLMRQFTGGREILHPAPTQFATNFIALQSILAQKDALKAMNQCTDIVKLTEPLVHVLRIVDGEDRAAMEFDKHKKIISGLLDVIERYAYGDADLNTKLTSEKRIFKNAEGDFGRMSAIRERSTVMPDQWWESYGCGAPNLQKLAIHVLSQTCSSSGCERNWSIFEHIHSKKRNRSEHQKLNDLVYVHYNLRLQQRNRMRKQSYDPICLDAFEDHSEWIMEDSPPFLTLEEVDALRNDLANMSLQSALDDLDELNLEDDRDDGEANNTPVKNANQNETNQDVAPDLSDEERYPDFEVTPWI